MFSHANRIVECVLQDATIKQEPLSVYWVKVNSSRQNIIEEIHQTISELPIVAVSPKHQGFENPNALLAEFSNLLRENKELIKNRLCEKTKTENIVILIVSYTDLKVPQIASPIELPEFIPKIGGTVYPVTIFNLNRDFSALLDCEESNSGGIAFSLYSIERAILTRMRAIYEKDKRIGESFFAKVKKNTTVEKYDDYLDICQKHSDNVINPHAYRPSTRLPNSILSALVRFGYQSGPETLTQFANSVQKALSINEELRAKSSHSIFSVLWRSTDRKANIDSAFGRGLIISCFCGFQYLTASHHADNYPRFPLDIIVSSARNIRESIDWHRNIIENLD